LKYTDVTIFDGDVDAFDCERGLTAERMMSTPRISESGGTVVRAVSSLAW
jgi:hypothetical protein